MGEGRGEGSPPSGSWFPPAIQGRSLRLILGCVLALVGVDGLPAPGPEVAPRIARVTRRHQRILPPPTTAPSLLYQAWPRLHSPNFSPDARFLLAGARDGFWRLFTTHDGRCVAAFPADRAGFSPSGRLLAIAAGRRIQLREFPSGSVRVEWLLDGPPVQRLAVSGDDGRLAVVAGVPRALGAMEWEPWELHVFDLASRSNVVGFRWQQPAPPLPDTLVLNAAGSRVYFDGQPMPGCLEVPSGQFRSVRAPHLPGEHVLQPDAPGPRILAVLDQPPPDGADAGRRASSGGRDPAEIRRRVVVFDPELESVVGDMEYPVEGAARERMKSVVLSPDLTRAAENEFAPARSFARPRLLSRRAGLLADASSPDAFEDVDEHLDVLRFSRRGEWMVCGSSNDDEMHPVLYPASGGTRPLAGVATKSARLIRDAAGARLATDDEVRAPGRPPASVDMERLLSACRLASEEDNRLAQPELRAWSRDGSRLLVSRGEVLFLADGQGRLLHRLGPAEEQELWWSLQGGGSMGLRGIAECLFTPDGSKVVVWGDVHVGLRAYDVASGRLLYRNTDDLEADRFEPGGLVASPDNRRVAIACWERTVIVNLAASRHATVLPAKASALGFSPDGLWLLWIAGDELGFWAVPEARNTRRLRSDLFRTAVRLDCLAGTSLVAVVREDHGVGLIALDPEREPREIGRGYRVGADAVVVGADGTYDAPSASVLDRLVSIPSGSTLFELAPGSRVLRQEPGLLGRLTRVP